jgi:hypothetical protein
VRKGICVLSWYAIKQKQLQNLQFFEIIQPFFFESVLQALAMPVVN